MIVVLAVCRSTFALVGDCIVALTCLMAEILYPCALDMLMSLSLMTAAVAIAICQRQNNSLMFQTLNIIHVQFLY